MKNFLLLIMVTATFACGEKDKPSASDNQPAGNQQHASTAAKMPDPKIDACALLTKQEAETILGESVGDATPEVVPPIFSCSYKTANFKTVSVSVTAYDTPQAAAAAHQMAIDINKYEELSGFGDRAYRSPIYEITVLKGRYEVSVDISHKGADADFEKAKEVTPEVLSRLP